VSQLLCAFEYLAQRKIIHNDVKLENILFVDDSMGQVKLIDFGLAGFGRQINMKSIKGTVYYYSPEMIYPRSYDWRTDMWSLGIVVYSLLMGKLPFYSKDETELCGMIFAMKYPQTDNWNLLPSDVQDFIQSLLTTEDKRMTVNEAKQHPWIQSSIS